MTLNGDPTPVGWTTFALYFVSAFLAFRRSRQEQTEVWQRSAWRSIAIILLIFGLNKEMDLHNSLIQMLPPGPGGDRPVAIYRWIFSIVILILVAIALRVFRRLDRLRAFALPVAGFACLAAYIFIRAGAMAQVDEIYNYHWDKNPIFSAFEIVGTLLIAAGALAPQRNQSAVAV